MAKAKLKTTATSASVAEFIAAVPDARRRAESLVVDALHRRICGCDPRMWGPSIIGYGQYSYRTANGREGVMCRAGFSPRKSAMTVYLTGDFSNHKQRVDTILAQLGKYSLGKSCLYMKFLDDIDVDVLAKLVALNWACMNETYPEPVSPTSAAAM